MVFILQLWFVWVGLGYDISEVFRTFLISFFMLYFIYLFIIRATLVNSLFLVPTNPKIRVGRSEIKKQQKKLSWSKSFRYY